MVLALTMISPRFAFERYKFGFLSLPIFRVKSNHVGRLKLRCRAVSQVREFNDLFNGWVGILHTKTNYLVVQILAKNYRLLLLRTAHLVLNLCSTSREPHSLTASPCEGARRYNLKVLWTNFQNKSAKSTLTLRLIMLYRKSHLMQKYSKISLNRLT